MKVYVLALDKVFDTGLATVLDAFETANELADMFELPTERFEVTIVGVRKSVRTAQGLEVPLQSADRCTPELVVVPAIGYKMPAALESALGKPEIATATDVLRNWAQQGATVASACIGTFVVAEAGLLDDNRATTTWWLAPLFRKRYPKVELDQTSMIVKSGQLITAGAALSHMDLALWLIRQKSPKLASLTAKYLIVDSRPTQSAYVITDHLVHCDPLVEHFEHWVRSRLDSGFSLDQAAAATGVSKRTLARRVQAVLGKSPLSYFQDVRVERAVHLLKTTTASIDEIATMVGYADGTTLRTLLRRQLGCGIKEIRASL